MTIRAVDLILAGVPDLWALDMRGIRLDWTVERTEYCRALAVIEALRADFIQRAILHLTDAEMATHKHVA